MTPRIEVMARPKMDFVEGQYLEKTNGARLACSMFPPSIRAPLIVALI